MAERIVARTPPLPASGWANRAPGEESVMEGSMAIAKAVKACRPAVISAYPITPQTHIVENLARMVAEGELDAEYIRVVRSSRLPQLLAAPARPESHLHGVLIQGLLLMTEVIYYLAGTRLPVVLTGANRQVSAPIGLQPEHQTARASATANSSSCTSRAPKKPMIPISRLSRSPKIIGCFSR